MLPDIDKTREELLTKLALASIDGSIGLFIGAGFSKAVAGFAKNWKDLITKCADELSIGIEDIFDNGKSFPDIASSICTQYSQFNNLSYEDACAKLKETICVNTNWFPDSESIYVPKYRSLLQEINPAWIITTNYDSILETILLDSYSIGPKQAFTFKKEKVPIYHLHGHRLEPDSIVITQEDYIELFRPGRYSQIKLSTMLKESTTLVLGYGLGDVNVLTAFDWAKNVYDEIQNYQDYDVVQINYQKNISKLNKQAYKMRNNIWVIDTDNILSFLEEFGESVAKEKQVYQEKIQNIELIQSYFVNPDPNIISEFTTNCDKREKLIIAIETIQKHNPSIVKQFIKQCLEYIKNESNKFYNFEAYNDWLQIILEIFDKIDMVNMHPAIFSLLAEYLDKLGPSIGNKRGQSFAAHDTWNKYRHKLNPKLIQELKSYAIVNCKFYLNSLLE